MAKKRKPGKGLPPRRHLRSVPTLSEPTPRGDRPQDQPLIQGLSAALRTGEPLDLLTAVGSLLIATDRRGRDPFHPGEGRPEIDHLVQSFVEMSYAETTAALLVIQSLTPDEVLAARIGHELATRTHPMPDWLTGLNAARLDPEVWFLTHVLGDGDDYLLGATLRSGHHLTALVYVDHNLGTVVKDAFIVPDSVAELTARVRDTIVDPDQLLTPIDHATARAAIEAAIDASAGIVPPLESDSWPMCRPLVEWLVRMLPAGGIVPERTEWSEAAEAALTDDFLSSRFAAGLVGPDSRALVQTLVWFGTSYGPGDPLRWTPVNVEQLLADWAPRKIVDDVEHLLHLPDVLRAFVRFCHDREGIRVALTAETLASVDTWEPAYQRLIRADRSLNAEDLLAGLLSGYVDLDDLDDDALDALLLQDLDEAVGGRARLMDLDVEPLPDEDFDWTGIGDDVRPAVEATLEACDRCADDVLDVEHRTAMRRFLRRAAIGAPEAFRRKASPVRGAAAVAWVICRANDTVGPWSNRTAKELLAGFGVTGSVSQRAAPYLRANGVDPDHSHGSFGAMHLGTPDLLVSGHRARIIAKRDRIVTS